MWSALRARIERIRNWCDTLFWGGIPIKLTPWRAFFLAFVVFWLVFSLPYYSKSNPYEMVPFDPVRGLLGGACFGMILGFFALVFQDRGSAGSGDEPPGSNGKS